MLRVVYRNSGFQGLCLPRHTFVSISTPDRVKYSGTPFQCTVGIIYRQKIMFIFSTLAVLLDISSHLTEHGPRERMGVASVNQ